MMAPLRLGRQKMAGEATVKWFDGLAEGQEGAVDRTWFANSETLQHARCTGNQTVTCWSAVFIHSFRQRCGRIAHASTLFTPVPA